ncbi:MAG TPA: hypothetical protein VFD59_02475, partial [Nocardioidaceae bacterium]|nr:hypothetical protein [Nocardioidaceae bacterium]
RTIVRTDEIYTRLGHRRRRIVGTDEYDTGWAGTASTVDHRQEQRPSTTLNNNSTNRSRPDNREPIKPATIQPEPVPKPRRA